MVGKVRCGDVAVTLLLGGDVNVQGRQRPELALAGLSPLLDAADVRFVNLEGLLVDSALGGNQLDIPHKPNWRHSGPEAVTALIAGHVDAVSCVVIEGRSHKT